MRTFEIDDTIPFCKRPEHKSHTIREIIRYDSGYLKDLFLKENRLVFSKECMNELLRLTKGHFDNWEKPKTDSLSLFHQLKTYASPYLFDFNTLNIEQQNLERLRHE